MDAISFYSPGSDLTVHASAALTGAHFVGVSGNRNAGDGLIAVTHAIAATGPVLGIMRTDVANGKLGPCITEVDTIAPVLAAGAIAAGQLVVSDALGRAVALAPAGLAAGAGVIYIAGVCVTAAADATLAQILFRPFTLVIPA